MSPDRRRSSGQSPGQFEEGNTGDGGFRGSFPTAIKAAMTAESIQPAPVTRASEDGHLRQVPFCSP